MGPCQVETRPFFGLRGLSGRVSEKSPPASIGPEGVELHVLGGFQGSISPFESDLVQLPKSLYFPKVCPLFYEPPFLEKEESLESLFGERKVMSCSEDGTGQFSDEPG